MDATLPGSPRTASYTRSDGHRFRLSRQAEAGPATKPRRPAAAGDHRDAALERILCIAAITSRVPTLRRRYTALATGLIVGFLWGTWHVLIAVWASRGLAGEASLTGFIAGLVAFYFVALPAYRVLMVWVYDHTASLLLAMLRHAVLSASTIVLQPVSAHGQFTWNLLLGAALWA